MTLDWYRHIEPGFVAAAFLSLRVALIASLISSVLATGIALAVARDTGPWISLLEIVATAPLSVPQIVIGVSLYQAAVVVWDMTDFAVAGTFWGILVGHVVLGIPFCVRAVMISHSFYERSVEEAALNLGASRFYTLRNVTLPILLPGIASGAFLAFLASFDDVPIALFMGGGDDSTTLPLQILGAMEFSLKPDVMALSTVVVVITMIAMVFVDKTVGLERFFGGR